MDTDVTVSNQLWLELLHAEASWALAEAGVDTLVIKGPSISGWLYPEGGRESADVDLLVRPSGWDTAVATLTARGFARTYAGFRETESALHSLDVQRTDREQGQHGLDLHRYFPGIDAEPEDAFDVLWRDRVPADQAGVEVCFPSLEARALIGGLHVARQPGITKSMEDLRRAMAALNPVQVEAMADLARRLDAQAALRAGLETMPETSGYVERLGLADVEVPAHWALLSQGAGLLPIELERVWSLPPGQRVRQLVRWLLPTTASMRARHPEVGDSSVRLAGVYVRRWGSGVHRLPGAVREIRRARNHGTNSG